MSNTTTAVDWPYLRENSASPCSSFSPGRPAGRETMVTPCASTGTAQHTAKSLSASAMLRLGMTSSSCMYGAPVTIALVPLITMPFALRSTTCT